MEWPASAAAVRRTPSDVGADGGGDPFGKSLLRRVGLSVLDDNDDYGKRAREEVADAERCLQELRQRSQLDVARCLGQLNVAADEARAEEERRLISERVDRELSAFREEMRRKEALEEERLCHVYRGLAAKEQQEPPSHSSVAYSLPNYNSGRHHLADGAVTFPPLIYSAVTLTEDSGYSAAVPAPCLRSDTKLGARGSGHSGGQWTPSQEDPALPRSSSSDVYRAAGQSWRRRTPMPEAAVSVGRQRRAPGTKGGGDAAEKLLQINLARLERLQQLGL